VNRPIRVLHVVGAMNRGGVETWLLNVMRRLSRDHVAIDLMVHTDERAAYDDEVVALGATIHRNPHTKELGRYGLCLRHVLGGSRRYDVVHITREVIVVADRVSRVPLGDAAAWAHATVEAFTVPPRSRDAAPALSGSPFDIAVSAQTLLESYCHALARRGARRRTGGASRKHVPVGARASVGD
jgi:hypothetical protein